MIIAAVDTGAAAGAGDAVEFVEPMVLVPKGCLEEGRGDVDFRERRLHYVGTQAACVTDWATLFPKNTRRATLQSRKYVAIYLLWYAACVEFLTAKKFAQCNIFGVTSG